MLANISCLPLKICDYQTSLKLDQLGFDEINDYWYDNKENLLKIVNDSPNDLIIAPYIHSASNWIESKYNIYINYYPTSTYSLNSGIGWYFELFLIEFAEGEWIWKELYKSMDFFSSKDNCLEEAIKIIVNNLI